MKRKSEHTLQAVDELRDATEQCANAMARARQAYIESDEPAFAKALHDVDKCVASILRRTGTLRYDLGISIKSW